MKTATIAFELPLMRERWQITMRRGTEITGVVVNHDQILLVGFVNHDFTDSEVRTFITAQQNQPCDHVTDRNYRFIGTVLAASRLFWVWEDRTAAEKPTQ